MKEHVAIVLKNKKDEILFIKRSMKKKTLPGAWSFASGTVEEGEDVHETVKREAMEELGVEVEIERVFAKVELPEFSVKLIFVLCSVDKGEPFIRGVDEIDRFEWISFNDFFERFSDEEIGHGLIWLRKNPEIWKGVVL